jgi:uncharacterized cysteine cluster protein YcgN (CxxCxxCC family)
MAVDYRFWEYKTLDEMSAEEWEALCDGCARCCVHKFEETDRGPVHYTNLACYYLDIETCRCTCYEERHEKVPECLDLTPEVVPDLYWLPKTCSYRLISEGKPLPDWHPLVTGNRASARDAGMSVRGRVIPEAKAPEFADQLTTAPGDLPRKEGD